MDTIFVAVFSVTTIGIICAVILSTASKVMAVEVDERVEMLQNCLPGTNCGACGYPGCAGYAAALASEAGASPSLCTPGGAAVLEQISEILGVEAGDMKQKTAVVHCGGIDMNKKMEYKGIQTCYAAKPVFGGEGACAFGCLGYGDCAAICPESAICMETGIARAIPELCTGCGLCIRACPGRLITVEDAGSPAIQCASIERGAAVRKKCKNGCLGCAKCARECPEEAITVENYLAKIDHEKCGGCGHCAEVCVAKCILTACGANAAQ